MLKKTYVPKIIYIKNENDTIKKMASVGLNNY